MIDKLFLYDVCDEVDQLVILYEHIQLIYSIGKHAPSTRFDWARVDYMNGILVLGKIDSGVSANEWQYPLTLQIGELIQENTQ